MKSMLKILLVGLFLTGTTLSCAFSTEIDSFTQRYDSISNSLDRLNELTRGLIDEALILANQQGQCDKTVLYSSLRKKLGGALWGNLENILEKDPLIDRRSITREQSIYGELHFYQSFPIFLVRLGSILNVNGHIVGTDKFGHFFEEGYLSFHRAYIEGQGPEHGLDYDESTEYGVFGLETTGVYSYGDLVASFHGMRFWNQVLERPYVSCQDNRWVSVQAFDWTEVIDAGWDEGINCDHFYNSRFEDAVMTRIKELEEKYHHRYQCPVQQEQCQEMGARYREKFGDDLARRLVAPICL